jgi:hypothetical protein
VARAAELRAFWGGLYQRGAYMRVVWGMLRITNPPIRRVSSSYISGALPSFRVLRPTIYLIKGGAYMPTKCQVGDPLLGGGLYARGAYIKGGAYMPDYTVFLTNHPAFRASGTKSLQRRSWQ